MSEIVDINVSDDLIEEELYRLKGFNFSLEQKRRLLRSIIELSTIENPITNIKNYNRLENKPFINNVELKGRLSLVDLCIQKSENGKGLSTNDFTDKYKNLLDSNGIKGDKGDTGERGPKGDTGEKGKDGRDGIDGKDGKDGINGTNGLNGKDGKDGKDGTGVTILGSYNTEEELKKAHPTGEVGESYIVGGNLYVWSNTINDWLDVGKVQGPPGPKGETGEAGINGANGKDGSNGTNGKDGKNGISIKSITNRDVPEGIELTITLDDNSEPKKFIVKNGKDGKPGDKGEPGTNGSNGTNGKDGDSPTIGSNGNWIIKGVQTNNPSRGAQGNEGIGIKNIVTDTAETSGYNNKITINLTNGTKKEFYIKNGKDGKPGNKGDKGEKGENANKIVYSTEPITNNLETIRWYIGKDIASSIKLPLPKNTAVNDIAIIYCKAYNDYKDDIDCIFICKILKLSDNGSDFRGIGLIEEGNGITSIKQDITSQVDGGQNRVAITTTDGKVSYLYFNNGNKGSDGRPGSDATVTKTAVENVLTGNITSHIHDQYVTKDIYEQDLGGINLTLDNIIGETI